jgi:lipid-A-disaccharide synthase
MPVFTRAIAMLSTCYPRPTLVIAVPEHAMSLLFPYLNTCPFRVIITENDEDKRNAIAASRFAFVKSGTVTFEVAMAGVPMLVTYRMNTLSVWWLRRMIITKYANLINILLKKEVIPELLQEHSTPLMLASCANTLLKYPDLQQKQKESVRSALEQLKPEGADLPSDIAAKKILSLLS